MHGWHRLRQVHKADHAGRDNPIQQKCAHYTKVSQIAMMMLQGARAYKLIAKYHPKYFADYLTRILDEKKKTKKADVMPGSAFTLFLKFCFSD